MSDTLELQDTSNFIRPLSPIVYIGSPMSNDSDAILTGAFVDIVADVFRDAGFTVYNPRDHTMPGSPHTCEEVFATNYYNSTMADLVFFVRTCPSHGMGMEAHSCSCFVTPWADVRDPLDKTSPMLSGLPIAPGQFRITLQRDEPNEFEPRLRRNIDDLLERANQVASIRRDVLSTISNCGLASVMRAQRLMLRQELSAVGDRADICGEWIGHLERSPRLIAGLSQTQLARIQDTLRLQVIPGDESPFSCPRFAPIDSWPEDTWAEALYFSSLADSARKCDMSAMHDAELLDRWAKYAAEKRLELPEIPEGEVENVNSLTCYVTWPMSEGAGIESLAVNEKYRKLLSAICRQCSEESGIEITPKFPNYRKSHRDDHAVEIYNETLSRVSSCDFGILLASPAATGVGVMYQIFAASTMPVLIVANGNQAGRMMQGGFAKTLGGIHQFAHDGMLTEIIKNEILTNVSLLRESAGRRRRAVRKVASLNICQWVDYSRIQRGLTEDRMWRTVEKARYVRSEWAKSVFMDPEILPHVSVFQLVHLAKQLRWKVCAHESGLLSIRALPQLSKSAERIRRRCLTDDDLDAMDRSMHSLLGVMSEPISKAILAEDDEVLFEGWSDYSMQVVGAHSNHRTFVMTADHWKQILFSDGDSEL